jgi:hypothetical protein
VAHEDNGLHADFVVKSIPNNKFRHQPIFLDQFTLPQIYILPSLPPVNKKNYGTNVKYQKTYLSSLRPQKIK